MIAWSAYSLSSNTVPRCQYLFCKSRVESELTEGQFFQRSACSLGIHKVDECKLEDEPSCNDGQVFPANSGNGDGINVLCEETADLAPDLFDCDSAGSLSIGK